MELVRDKVRLDEEWCRELIPGAAYFTVHYFEPGVNIPQIETFVYLGQGRFEGSDEIAYIFQGAESYCEFGDVTTMEQSVRPPLLDHLLSFSKESIGDVADIDGVLVLLQGLAKRIKLGMGWDRILPDD